MQVSAGSRKRPAMLVAFASVRFGASLAKCGAASADIAPTSPRYLPNQATICEFRPQSGQPRRQVERMRTTHLVEIGPSLGRLQPSSVRVRPEFWHFWGRLRPDLARAWLNLGRSRPDVARTRHKFEQARARPSRAELGRMCVPTSSDWWSCQPKLARGSPGFARDRSRLGRCRSRSAPSGPQLTSTDPVHRDLGRGGSVRFLSDQRPLQHRRAAPGESLVAGPKFGQPERRLNLWALRSGDLDAELELGRNCQPLSVEAQRLGFENMSELAASEGKRRGEHDKEAATLEPPGRST